MVHGSYNVDTKDVMINAISSDGFVSVLVASTTLLTKHAQRIHGMTLVAAAALGRLLTAASLMSGVLNKSDASLTLQMNGGGSAGSLVAISDDKGNVRGFAQNPNADAPLTDEGRLDIKAIVGIDGMLTVTREFRGMEPHIGATRLVSGDIAGDVTEYFDASEQIQATCALDVMNGGSKTVLAAGGYIAQLLPDASAKAAKTLKSNMAATGEVGGVLFDGGLEALLDSVMSGLSPHIISCVPIEYKCTCNRERVLSALSSLGRKDLDELRSVSGPIEVCCQYCRATYSIDI